MPNSLDSARAIITSPEFGAFARGNRYGIDSLLGIINRVRPIEGKEGYILNSERDGIYRDYYRCAISLSYALRKGAHFELAKFCNSISSMGETCQEIVNSLTILDRLNTSIKSSFLRNRQDVNDFIVLAEKIESFSKKARTFIKAEGLSFFRYKRCEIYPVSEEEYNFFSEESKKLEEIVEKQSTDGSEKRKNLLKYLRLKSSLSFGPPLYVKSLFLTIESLEIDCNNAEAALKELKGGNRSIF